MTKGGAVGPVRPGRNRGAGGAAGRGAGRAGGGVPGGRDPAEEGPLTFEDFEALIARRRAAWQAMVPTALRDMDPHERRLADQASDRYRAANAEALRALKARGGEWGPYRLTADGLHFEDTRFRMSG